MLESGLLDGVPEDDDAIDALCCCCCCCCDDVTEEGRPLDVYPVIGLEPRCGDELEAEEA